LYYYYYFERKSPDVVVLNVAVVDHQMWRKPGPR
jgi:hypothetical protein